VRTAQLLDLGAEQSCCHGQASLHQQLAELRSHVEQHVTHRHPHVGARRDFPQLQLLATLVHGGSCF
jgi:hypothetical protein